MPRTRIIANRFVSGGFASRYSSIGDTHKSWQPSQYDTYWRERHECVDEVNKRDKDNPLQIKHTGRLFVPLNGTWQANSSVRVEFREYLPESMKISLSHAMVMTDLIPSVGTVATSVIAKSNPSKPVVSVPNFLYELKDLPGMIRDIGHLKIQLRNLGRKGFQRIHAKNSANHLLAYQMGWAPLLSDLRKLLSFQSDVDKKMRELRQLYTKGGIQRRVRSQQWKANHDDVVFSSVPCDSAITTTIRHRVTRTSSIERWGTVRWIPTDLPSPDFSSKDLAKLARDLTFGMRGLQAKQAWDAIPWTWLIGWFSNVDEFIQARSNAIPLAHSTPCIMTSIYTKYSWVRLDAINQIEGGTGDASLSEKYRTTSSGSLSASIPFLNARQLSIIGALFIQRKR